jgi:DNA-binding NtrC family response regulator
MKPYILVVDDEPDICSSVRDVLEDEGHLVAVAENGDTARRLVRARAPDLILLDVWMPDIDGISLLKEFTAVGVRAPVIMMSGHGTVETAVEATRLGARDFLEKPLSLAKLLYTVEHALQESRDQQSQAARTPIKALAPVGKSIQMQLLRELLDRLAPHEGIVLLEGEAGSGKTFCARYLHARGPRVERPFVNVHTRLLHDGQGAALLFGLEPAARPNGATAPGPFSPGFLEQAQGGTLYIDDIAELDLEIQKSLYGVLQSGKWVRLHGSAAQPLDIRLICATAHDLELEVRAGRFDAGLYQLLKGVSVRVPPLREHVEDISELLAHFVRLLSDQEGMPYRNFTVAAQNRLRHYAWPGNVRELMSLVRRLLVLGFDSDIQPDEIDAALKVSAAEPPSVAMPEFDLPLREAREQFEKAYLEYHMRQADHSVGKVAKQVGMERTHLYRKLRSLGIDARRSSREK